MQKHKENSCTKRSPEVIVHRFKEELVVWFLERIFQVQKGDPFGRDGQFDQVWSFLVVEMVDNFSLPHCRPLGRSERWSSSAGVPQMPLQNWVPGAFTRQLTFCLSLSFFLSFLPCLPSEFPGIFFISANIP